MFKPMLAATAKSMSLITYPVITSPKLDGIRIVITEDGPLTRSLKPIPNLHIRKALSDPAYRHFDGEIIVGDRQSVSAFNTTQSAVMSIAGTPEFSLIVFDSFETPTDAYTKRFTSVQARIDALLPHSDFSVEAIANKIVNSEEELDNANMEALYAGYEGIMFRQPSGPYKFGRSTERAGTLIKMKPFADGEAEIIDIEWIQRNHNVATTNALGRTERSSHKSGKIADKREVGALVVRGISEPFDGVEFKIGTGFTQDMRRKLATEDFGLFGNVVTYVYQDEGSKDAPRFPRFKGFRDRRDLS